MGDGFESLSVASKLFKPFDVIILGGKRADFFGVELETAELVKLGGRLDGILKHLAAGGSYSFAICGNGFSRFGDPAGEDYRPKGPEEVGEHDAEALGSAGFGSSKELVEVEGSERVHRDEVCGPATAPEPV